ncbi:MAG: CDP-alcohol phosphatidyltransferase family protein [Marinifilaceae bacterium]|jgi:CDP-diacylglycerol--serine O-phosphatidyltransferase|nr:CDP-alcohol phosphatidyltransferase family protein [Marinifilaceae bacterium]
MNIIKRNIPNTITSLNLAMGCCSIFFSLNGDVKTGAILIIFASIFDFFDGMSARLLKAYSELGKQLDSLADLISFGLAPTCIAFFYLHKLVFGTDEISLSTINLNIDNSIILLVLIIPIFSALRLAKFNIDERQTDSFIGMPTPGNAILWASIPLILNYSESELLQQLTNNIYLLSGLIILSSSILVAELPMFSLKFKNLSFNNNKLRFAFIGLAIIEIIIFRFSSIPLIIISYISLSIINIIFKKQHQS